MRSDIARVLIAAAFVMGIAALALGLKIPFAFAWIWLAVVLSSGMLAVRLRTPLLRHIALAGIGLGLALIVLEGAFIARSKWSSNGVTDGGTYVLGGYAVTGGALGYAPKAGRRITSAKSRHGQTIYDVAYTITDQGVRHTIGSPTGDTWLFMGDSFTFGEGLNDDETLPSQFSVALGGRANVVNLGYHGYGPHQVLRALETDIPAALIHRPVRAIIYQGISHHPARAAGRVRWDLRGPRYVLSGSGVAYAGPMHGRVVALALNAMQRSAFLQFVMDRTLYRETLSDDDIERYARILVRSAQVARSKYSADFTVLFWDDDDEDCRRIGARLRRSRLTVIPVSEVIPRAQWTSLAIPFDDHPTKEANRRLARALVDRLAGASQSALQSM